MLNVSEYVRDIEYVLQIKPENIATIYIALHID